jgi:hypothetical protein
MNVCSILFGLNMIVAQVDQLLLLLVGWSWPSVQWLARRL